MAFPDAWYVARFNAQRMANETQRAYYVVRVRTHVWEIVRADQCTAPYTRRTLVLPEKRGHQ